MKVLPSPPLVPSSMSTGSVYFPTASSPGPGSPSVMPLPPMAGAVIPLPQLGAGEPVNPQAGQHGGAGLPHASARPPEGGADGAPWPAGDQGISTGPWHKTPGFP